MNKMMRKGIDCPYCGGVAVCTKAGRANENTIFIRLRKCTECKRTSMTAEFPLRPGETTINRLDEEDHYRRMQYDRHRNGYEGKKIHPPKTADKLAISYRVIRGTMRPFKKEP